MELKLTTKLPPWLVLQDDVFIESYQEELQKQAKLTAKQIYEWGREPCPHDTERYLRKLRRECPKCWQELQELSK